MLTKEDCIDLCELTVEEVEAIAEHESLPDIIAAELGNYLVHTDDGIAKIQHIILDDIEMAERRGDTNHAVSLKMTLRHFVQEHPLI